MSFKFSDDISVVIFLFWCFVDLSVTVRLNKCEQISADTFIIVGGKVVKIKYWI